jgi:hypothetical protein
MANGRVWSFTVAVLLLGVRAIAGRGQDADTRLPFSCEVFSARTSATALGSRFGSANVATDRVPWGGAEGDYNEGTVLFGGHPDARLEIYWRDTRSKRDPEWVSVRGKHTRWQSTAGITLGTPLRTVERLNGGPFRLLGFGSDVSGTVLGWSGGRLEAQNSNGCRVRLRLGIDWGSVDAKAAALINQVLGEREFSSGHPVMQQLNPTVYELFLQYDRVPANSRMHPTAATR